MLLGWAADGPFVVVVSISIGEEVGAVVQNPMSTKTLAWG